MNTRAGIMIYLLAYVAVLIGFGVVGWKFFQRREYIYVAGIGLASLYFLGRIYFLAKKLPEAKS